MFENFGMNITNLFKRAELERKELHHPYVGTEHMLLAILKNDDEFSKYLNNYGLYYENFFNELYRVIGVSKRDIEINLYTPLLKRVINNAIDNAKEFNDGIVTVKHLIISMLEEGEGIAIRLLIGMGIDIDSIYSDLSKDKKLVNKKLDVYDIGILLNEHVDKSEKVIGRDKEIDLMIETLLRKKKNNPILIGEAGVGKTAIVEEFTRRIERKEVPEDLFNKKIVMLEMGTLVSGTKYRGEFEEKLTNIIKEVESTDEIILFIDEIHTMVNAGGAEGAITAGDIFKPALARGNIKVIGATTINEYNKSFELDKALKRRFEAIVVDEPNKEETKDILSKIKNEYESHHNVKISEELINKIVDITSKFIFNKKNPDKSIDFLDSVCSYVKTKNNYNKDLKLLYDELEMTIERKKECVKKNNYDRALNLYNEEMYLNDKIKLLKNNDVIEITEEDIIKVLENKTNLPLTTTSLSYLSKIEKELNTKYYNLNDTIKNLCQAMKENLLNKVPNLKILIKGPVGVGKSSIVEDIALATPKMKNFIKIDMKEFNTPGAINKLLGASQGYVGYNDDYLLKKIKNNTFNILLFDNYELANDEMKELIKKILQEGSIIDNKGEIINFANTMIFITENITKDCVVGFNNTSKKKVTDIDSLVDEVVNIDGLSLDILNKYLNSLKIRGKEKEKIIKDSEYQKYNYKKLNKLVSKKKVCR